MQLNRIKKLITTWLKGYANKNNIQTFVVGISGGIDSALTSTLCAMSNIHTIAVSMPIHQKKKELDNANKHMKWLSKTYQNVKITTIELSEVFKKYKTIIPLEYQSDLGLANSRARIRMTTLYQIASKKRGLVVGTGNKIEDFGIGFFTKYGDGGVDISPIADLTKSEVRELAKFFGITKAIIDAPPTDGLWEDERTDETQIGATYKDLEWAMEYNSLKKENRNDKLTTKEKKVLKIYRKLHKDNQHKMTPIPICKIPNELRISKD